MTKQLERLTEDTPAWYAGTRAALEQAGELRRILEELGERLGKTREKIGV